MLVGIRDHHANIVPWQILAKELNLTINFIQLKKDYSIDREDFKEKYDNKVKLVALGHVSNVTGQILELHKVQSILREDTFFLIDGSQSFPHIPINVQKLACDAFIFTGHKAMSYTGIGVVYLNNKWIKKIEPIFS
ncbi:MAG: aminotransferase class V-fold PLP-dependent enzyme [bacterium]|nr:aminotransferase class V-fold PLP-dependent enzyme [bacterium]